MNQHSKATPKAWRAEWYLALVVLGLGFAFWPDGERTSVTQAVQEDAREQDAVELVSRGRGQDARQTPLSIGTMPIQSIAVGQRVLGEDPLIDDATSQRGQASLMEGSLPESALKRLREEQIGPQICNYWRLLE